MEQVTQVVDFLVEARAHLPEPLRPRMDEAIAALRKFSSLFQLQETIGATLVAATTLKTTAEGVHGAMDQWRPLVDRAVAAQEREVANDAKRLEIEAAEQAHRHNTANAWRDKVWIPVAASLGSAAVAAAATYAAMGG